jgi:hypothetical protein
LHASKENPQGPPKLYHHFLAVVVAVVVVAVVVVAVVVVAVVVVAVVVLLFFQ